MESFTFKLQSDEKKPLYEQLYRHIIGEMEAGRLEEGEKLPSKRAVCAHLGVSRSTVETAYGMLCAEGYVRSVPKSGYFVSAALARTVPSGELPVKKQAETAKVPSARYDFSTGAVDTTLFPYAAWARLSREVIGSYPSLLQRGDAQGDADFREKGNLRLF